MRRSGPLRRRVPLRSAAPLRHRTRSHRRRATGPTPAVAGTVLERAQYSCERCARMVGDRRGIDYSLHHRRPRRSGGTSDPVATTAANLILLCGHGTLGCHGEVERRRAAAYAAGWLVRAGQDPARVPVLLDHGDGPRLVLLAADGRIREVAR